MGRSAPARGRATEQKSKADDVLAPSKSPDLDAMDDALFGLGKKKQASPQQSPLVDKKTPNEKGDGLQSRQNLTVKKPTKPTKSEDYDDVLGDLDDLLNSDDEGAKPKKQAGGGKKKLGLNQDLDDIGATKGVAAADEGDRGFGAAMDDAKPSTSTGVTGSSDGVKKRPPINFDDDDDDDPDGMNFLSSLLKTNDKGSEKREEAKGECDDLTKCR